MSKKLYVGNLSFSATEETLTQTFSAFGTIDSVKLITDRDTGRSKGFGFVEMASSDEADNAILQMNGKELDGRPLTVNEARPMVPRSESYSRGGRQDSGYGRGNNDGAIRGY
jgi:RNA recognition motif-containing protein